MLEAANLVEGMEISTTIIRTPAVFVSGIYKATTLYTMIKTPDKVITSNLITESQIWNSINIFKRLYGVRRARWESLETSKVYNNNLGYAHKQIQAPPDQGLEKVYLL